MNRSLTEFYPIPFSHKVGMKRIQFYGSWFIVIMKCYLDDIYTIATLHKAGLKRVFYLWRNAFLP